MLAGTRSEKKRKKRRKPNPKTPHKITKGGSRAKVIGVNDNVESTNNYMTINNKQAKPKNVSKPKKRGKC